MRFFVIKKANHMTNCKAEKKGNKNMSGKEQKAYYAVIPANVRYDKRLKANEKLLYGEITALTNERGYCWAGNKYFSDLYGVTPQAVSKWINGLKDCGYISIEYTYKNGTKEIESRIIKLVSTNVSDVLTNDSEVLTNVSGGINKCLRGYKQKVKDNDTDNNTDNNTVRKKERKSKSKSYDEQIAEYTQDEELQDALKAFVQMRAFIKKPLTEYGLKLLLNKLSKIGKTDAEKIAIVNRSVEHNWQGFFEIKEESSYQKSVQPEKKYDQNGYESEEELMKMFYGK